MEATHEDTALASTDCPPSDAIEAHGEVFRCCKRESPIDSDLETHEERGLALNADPCRRKAISVFTTREDAEHQGRTFIRWKKVFVMSAKLAREHGVMKVTPGQQPTHTSWWPSPNLPPAERAKLFTRIGKVQG